MSDLGASSIYLSRYPVGTLSLNNPARRLTDNVNNQVDITGNYENKPGANYENISVDKVTDIASFGGALRWLQTPQIAEVDESGVQTGGNLSSSYFNLELSGARYLPSFKLGNFNFSTLAGVTLKYYNRGLMDTDASSSSSTFGTDLSLSGKLGSGFLTVGILDLGMHYKDKNGGDDAPLPTSGFLEYKHHFSFGSSMGKGTIIGNMIIGAYEKAVTEANLAGEFAWTWNKSLINSVSLNPGIHWNADCTSNYGVIEPNLGVAIKAGPANVYADVKWMSNGGGAVYGGGFAVTIGTRKKTIASSAALIAATPAQSAPVTDNKVAPAAPAKVEAGKDAKGAW
jgi:hypothetical protein